MAKHQSEASAIRSGPNATHLKTWRGLLVRKERWGLSWIGRLAAFLILATISVGLIRGLHPFLAVTDSVSGEIMVIEGWVPTYVLDQVINQYQNRRYEEVLVVRSLYKGKNSYESGEFMANYVAEQIIAQGVPRDRVQVLFCEPTQTDRTYGTALAVRTHLARQKKAVEAMDVISLGPHARRSRMLYRRAFEGKVAIGIIALDDPSYDGVHWWRSSAGVREVPFELLAYLYARFLFTPERTAA